MNDRILFPYIFTDSELETIEIHFQTHTDWTKPIFSSIKNNIIEYLRIQQGNTCCYCKYQMVSIEASSIAINLCEIKSIFC